MNAREMQKAVEQKILSLEIPSRKFKSEDIFDWLNVAQDKFIKNRLDSILYNNADNFENIQKEVDDLRLIISKSNPVEGSVENDSKVYNLPDQYRHSISISVYVSSGECDPLLKKVRLYSNEIILDVLEETLYKPTKKSPVASLMGNKFIIYFNNNFSLGNAIITHIKIPNKIGISTNLTLSNCELAEHTHPDIVDLAVEYAYRILNVNQTQNN